MCQLGKCKSLFHKCVLLSVTEATALSSLCLVLLDSRHVPLFLSVMRSSCQNRALKLCRDELTWQWQAPKLLFQAVYLQMTVSLLELCGMLRCCSGAPAWSQGVLTGAVFPPTICSCVVLTPNILIYCRHRRDFSNFGSVWFCGVFFIQHIFPWVCLDLENEVQNGNSGSDGTVVNLLPICLPYSHLCVFVPLVSLLEAG